MCFEHYGHPKRTLATGDITEAMRAEIRSAAHCNMPISTLQALLYDNFKIYASYQQLHFESLGGIQVVQGNVINRVRASANQAEQLISWILNALSLTNMNKRNNPPNQITREV